MEHFCIDALYPEYKMWEQYTTDAMGAAQRLDALRTSHPIIVPIKVGLLIDFHPINQYRVTRVP